MKALTSSLWLLTARLAGAPSGSAEECSHRPVMIQGQAHHEACRSKGATVPVTDLLIAACAECHGLALLHHDGHFDQIKQALGRG